MGLLLGASFGAWTAATGRAGGPGLASVACWIARPTLVGAIALGLLTWILLGVASYSHSLYRGDFLLVSFLVVIVIAVATRPASIVGRVLDCRPLRWIGVRSYSIYLWHWPIAVVTRPGIDTTMPVVARPAASGLAHGGCSRTLTYRFVETPVRRLRFPRGVRRLSPSRCVRNGGGCRRRRASPDRRRWRRWFVSAAIVILVGPAAPNRVRRWERAAVVGT